MSVTKTKQSQDQAATRTLDSTDIRYAVGFNMKCRYVVCQVRIAERLNDPSSRYDCVTVGSDGIRVLGREADLHMTKKTAMAEVNERNARLKF